MATHLSNIVPLKTFARNKDVLKKLPGSISVQFVLATYSDISLIWLFTVIGLAFKIEYRYSVLIKSVKLFWFFISS